MWSSNKEHWAVARYSPRASGVHLAEEEVGEEGHDVDEGIVLPVAHGIQVPCFGRGRLGVVALRGPRIRPCCSICCHGGLILDPRSLDERELSLPLFQRGSEAATQDGAAR